MKHTNIEDELRHRVKEGGGLKMGEALLMLERVDHLKSRKDLTIKAARAFEKRVRKVIFDLDDRLDIVEKWMKFCDGKTIELPSSKAVEGNRLSKAANSAVFLNRPTFIDADGQFDTND